MKFVQKVWGSETWIHNDEDYCGKLLKVKKDFFTSLHKHKLKKETFYLQSGSVIIRFLNDGEPFSDIFNLREVELHPGDSFEVPVGMLHSIVGLEDSELFEFSSQHFDSDSYRVTKSGKLN